MNKKEIIPIAKQTAIISGAFVVLMCILLLVNYWHTSRVNPIENESLKVLIERLADEPNSDYLKKEIRQLDLMARKAYFTSIWQVKTGSLFLIISAIIFVIALRIYHSFSAKVELPVKSKESDVLSRLLAQRWIFIAAALLLILSLLATFKTTSFLQLYEGNAIATSQDTEDETIEVIEVGEVVKGSTNTDTIKQVVTDTSTTKITTAKPAQTFKAFYTKQDVLKNYNTFRGPFGLGVSQHKNIPTNWNGNSGNKIKWKTDLSKGGYNSPVIWGDKLFVAGGDNAARFVYCIDKNTGKLLWEHKADNIPGTPAAAPKTTDDTGLSAPTLATDGKYVYAIFGTGDIVALDYSGKRVWGKNIGVPDNHYGHSSSLICWQNKVFIQFDSNKGGRLLALNILTGDVLWENKRDSRISWASPILVEHQGKFQLVLSSDPAVAGYNIETGKELWRVDCLMGEIGPSPAYADGIVYGSNEYATLAAIDINTHEILWETNEYLPEVASPVVSEGLLFVATSYAVFACYDARTGYKYWEFEEGSGFYASPVVADGKVYISETGGVTYIFEVSKEKKLLGSPALGEKLFATPAFDDGRIYLRTNKTVYCIE